MNPHLRDFFLFLIMLAFACLLASCAQIPVERTYSVEYEGARVGVTLRPVEGFGK